MSEARPRVAVSACLLGEPVRYDGKEKRVQWIADVLPLEVEVVAICPEVGAGMPVPRPPIQVLRRPGEALRIVVVGEGRCQTAAMEQYIAKQLAQLRARPVDGYIFKARSPSCGLRDTPYFDSAESGGTPVAQGAGLWAHAVAAQFPELPRVDESEVIEAAAQEQFLARVRDHFQARG